MISMHQNTKTEQQCEDFWKNRDAKLREMCPLGTQHYSYFSTKMMAASVFAVAVDRGWLSYGDLVTKHWPEFGQNGKGEMKISDVLRHDAGLHTLDAKLSLKDVAEHKDRNGAVSQLFAKQKPWAWAEGQHQGKTPRIYHAVSRGWILNQIKRYRARFKFYGRR